MITALPNYIGDVLSPLAHSTVAVFQLGLPFDPRMMPRKFLDNGSAVIMLTVTQTNKQTKSQTDTTENNSTLATLRCAGCNKHIRYAVDTIRSQGKRAI